MENKGGVWKKCRIPEYILSSDLYVSFHDTLMDNMLCIVYDEKVGILKNCEYNLTRVNRPPPDPSS